MKRRVVVTGIGALTPIGNNPQELWESVKAGKCGIDFIKNFDTSNHKVKIAAEIKNFNMDDYIEKRDAKKMDTYCQYAVVSAKQAFADSGLDIEKSIRNVLALFILQALVVLVLWNANIPVLWKNPMTVCPRSLSPC